MIKYINKQLTVLLAGLFLMCAHINAQSFGFAEIPLTHYIGTGANTSGLVIDFNDGAATERYLFAYQWDGVLGDVSGAEMLDAVASGVPELSYVLGGGTIASGAYFETISYDTQSETAGDFETNFDYWVYFIAGGTAGGNPIAGAGSQIPDVVNSSPTGASADSFGSPGRFIENNSWDVWSYGPGESTYVVPEPSAYALMAGLLVLSWIGIRRRV